MITGDSIDGRLCDMRKAYDAGAVLSALSLALCIPDICGKQLYPNARGSKDRYCKWFDQYVVQRYSPTNSHGDEYFNGRNCYQLRCSFLHEGTNRVDENKREDPRYYFIQFNSSGFGPNVMVDTICHVNSVSERSNRIKQQNVIYLDLDKFVSAIIEGGLMFIKEHPSLNKLGPDAIELSNVLIPYRPVDGR